MTSKTYATREQFLAPTKRRYKDVHLPFKGITVRIRSLMEAEKEEYEAGLITAKAEYTRDTLQCARRRLIAYCLCDENGDQLLSLSDLDALKALDGADMAYLQEECQVHCGFKKGDIEGLVKNSESVPADNSPTE